MSRRDRNEPELRKKNRQEDPGQEQEEADKAAEVEKKQEQTRDAAQDQIGNQGIAAMLGVASVKPGEAGLSVDAIQNREEESGGLQFGGEEPPPDGPLTLDDLVRNWNPTTRRGQDTPDQALGLYHPLPEEDEELLHAVTSMDGRLDIELPPMTEIDPLLQPHPDVLLEDLGPLVRQALRFADPSLLHRTWAYLASPPAPLLTDPHGRLLHTRARTATLAVLLSIEALSAGAPRETTDETFTIGASPAALYLLDLASRRRAIDEAQEEVRASEVRLPVCRDVLAALLQQQDAQHGTVTLRPLGPCAARHLHAALTDLMALPPPSALVPSLPEQAEDEPRDDPLGIDALLAASLGVVDPQAGVYDTLLQAAEKLAGAAARLRTHAAGALLAVALAASSWSSGVPAEALLDVASEIDRSVNETLQLLVEIGRALQRRAVPPLGVRNGLRRVARALEVLAAQIPSLVAPVVAGVLPVGPDLPPPSEAPTDPLSQAWADAEPATALPWLASLPPSLDNRAAIAMTRASCGASTRSAPEWLALSGEARARGSALQAAALSLCAGAALIYADADDAALTWAEHEMSEALARRNGIWLAASALVAIDIRARRGEMDEALALRMRGARLAWRLGARAALSLLLRWRPPADEDEDDSYTYPYPDEEVEAAT